VIFEVVGGDIFEQSLRCINVGGRILVLGFAGGRIGNAPANLPLLKNASIVGSFLGGWRHRDPAGVAAMTRDMLDMVAKSALKTPVAQTFAMRDAAAAMKLLVSRSTVGQMVLIP
jgi:NADPH2:quinone reductase